LPIRTEGKRRGDLRLSSSSISYFLHPEQAVQQSSDEQQPACAAAAAPVNPSTITTIDNITLNVLMIFPLLI
jgi:hypothetical protein